MTREFKILGYRAIVICSSIAELLTNKVLFDYFQRVTIVERNRFNYS